MIASIIGMWLQNQTCHITLKLRTSLEQEQPNIIHAIWNHWRSKSLLKQILEEHSVNLARLQGCVLLLIASMTMKLTITMHHDASSKWSFHHPWKFPPILMFFFKHRFVESFTVTTSTAHHLRFFQKICLTSIYSPRKLTWQYHLKMYLLFKHGDFFGASHQSC